MKALHGAVQECHDTDTGVVDVDRDLTEGLAVVGKQNHAALQRLEFAESDTGSAGRRLGELGRTVRAILVATQRCSARRCTVARRRLQVH